MTPKEPKPMSLRDILFDFSLATSIGGKETPLEYAVSQIKELMRSLVPAEATIEPKYALEVLGWNECRQQILDEIDSL